MTCYYTSTATGYFAQYRYVAEVKLSQPQVGLPFPNPKSPMDTERGWEPVAKSNFGRKGNPRQYFRFAAYCAQYETVFEPW